MGLFDSWKDMGSGLLEKGLDLVGMKYQTDLQSKKNNQAYDKQRADALVDWEKEKAYNLDLWNKQNEYNSPVEQMKRLEAAGLNPRLMYGQGTTGNTTVIKAGDIHEPTLEVPRIPDLNLGGGIETYLAARRQGLMEENFKMEKALHEEQIKRMKEETRGVKRENDLLDSTFSSRFDPWYARLSSRLFRAMFGVDSPSVFERLGGSALRSLFMSSEGSRVTPPIDSRGSKYDKGWRILEIDPVYEGR